MNRIRVAIVDDHRVVSRSLSAYFALFEDLLVVGAAASGEELIERLDEWRPDIVVMDLLLPGGIDGIETTRRVRTRDKRVRVVALTASTDEARMTAVLRAGASGYVRKDADPETLLAAVRALAAGKNYIDPNAAGALAMPAEALSARELDVLRQLARGRANKEIAATLAIGEETVKTHVSNLIAKLDAENRTEVIVQALRRGVLSLDEIA